MGTAIAVRTDYAGWRCRRRTLRRRGGYWDRGRRLMATRAQKRPRSGHGPAELRDWVIRFNEQSPDVDGNG